MRVEIAALLVVFSVAGLGSRQAAFAKPAVGAETDSVTGTFGIRVGDPEAGPDHQYVYSVTDDRGREHRLQVGDVVSRAVGGVGNLNHKRVRVGGPVRHPTVRGTTPAPPVIEATSIEVTPGASPPPPQGVAGSQKFATILCRFADSTAPPPKDVAYVNGLMGDSYPGLSNFWRENSFNQVDNVGSVVTGWYNLPRPRSYYVPSSPPEFDRLAADCTAAADADVDFSTFAGINLLFDRDLDDYAWGGSDPLTLDGVFRFWPMTWMPPWGYAEQAVLGHEMGHAYGLPHSSGDYGQVYDSEWDVMSRGGRTRAPNPIYGHLGTDTIAYHKDQLGWIPPARKYAALTNTCGTITIDHLSQAPPTSGTYLMAQVPTTANRFYTVEARKFTGYDAGRIPGEAIVIHDVLTTREEPAHVVDATSNGNPNDAGAMWLPGETFNDAANGVSIQVLSSTPNGWSVRIIHGSCPLPSDTFASATTLEANSGTTVGSTLGATKEAGEPDHAANPGGASIWYSWTAPRDGTLAVDTLTSSFNTLLAVYTGPAVGSLTPVGANDDSGGGQQSAIGGLAVTGGVTYSIAVDGFNGATGSSRLTWAFTATVPVPPGPPTAVVAIAGNRSATVNWTPPADDGGSPITGYVVTPFVGTASLVASLVGLALTPLITDLVNGTPVTFRVAAVNAAGTGPESDPSNTVVPADGGRYHPLSPARILDTRNGTGGFSSPVGTGATIAVPVTGVGGVPASGVSAVVLNVTVTQPSAGGFLTLFPSGTSRPTASNLNFVSGQTVPNLVVAKVGADGKVAVFNLTGTAHVIFDVVGWFSA